MADLGLQADRSSGVVTKDLSKADSATSSSSPATTIFAILTAPIDIQRRIAGLVKQGKAKLLYNGDFPELINNTLGGISVVSKLSAVEAAQDTTGIVKKAAEMSQKKSGGILSVANVYSFNAVPTVNNNNSVTLAAKFAHTVQIVSTNPADSIPASKSDEVTSVLNAKENSTQVITGLSTGAGKQLV